MDSFASSSVNKPASNHSRPATPTRGTADAGSSNNAGSDALDGGPSNGKGELVELKVKEEHDTQCDDDQQWTSDKSDRDDRNHYNPRTCASFHKKLMLTIIEWLEMGRGVVYLEGWRRERWEGVKWTWWGLRVAGDGRPCDGRGEGEMNKTAGCDLLLSDEALGVRVSVARIAPSLLDHSSGLSTGVHPTLNIEVSRAEQSEVRRIRSSAGMKSGGNGTSFIVRHYSQLQKPGSDSAGIRTRFALRSIEWREGGGASCLTVYHSSTSAEGKSNVSDVPVLVCNWVALHYFRQSPDGTWHLPCLEHHSRGFVSPINMAEFTFEEYTDMILVYVTAEGNEISARRLYQERYTQRAAPSYNLFVTVTQRLRGQGTFTTDRNYCGAPKRRRTPELEEAVLHHVEQSPSASTRTIARALGVASTRWVVQGYIASHCEPLTPTRKEIMKGDMHRDRKGSGSHGRDWGYDYLSLTPWSVRAAQALGEGRLFMLEMDDTLSARGFGEGKRSHVDRSTQRPRGPRTSTRDPYVAAGHQRAPSPPHLKPHSIIPTPPPTPLHPAPCSLVATQLDTHVRGMRTENLPQRNQGANSRHSDYKSTTLPLSYEGRASLTYNSHMTSLHQELGNNDFPKCVDFCNYYPSKDRAFHRSILWTDEATFKTLTDIMLIAGPQETHIGSVKWITSMSGALILGVASSDIVS
ncbi:hypothetical protein PR048_018585 [Dryococelus australis]|uniref:DUF4817 domain-containing protein n=1 Tax=Dryococelus australis TaxID=614101 RepID=A0ABQ9HCV9_9NEOP|nr:hypothetical protein PR048_018585 [Dryococelus australis]